MIDTAKAANLWVSCRVCVNIAQLALGSRFTKMLTLWTSSMPPLVCQRSCF